MNSKVYFCNARATNNVSLIAKLIKLCDSINIDNYFKFRDKIAVKMHWGEPGNVAYLPVPFVRTVVKRLSNAKYYPFVTDTNALYVGKRFNAILNLKSASSNGFTQETVGAPIIVADGLKGMDHQNVKIDGELIQNATIASSIVEADGMVVLSHFKGHMLFGFGGALKNLGMGCASAAGKHVLHCDVKPKVETNKCTSCGNCIKNCPEHSIKLIDSCEGKKANINHDSCIGCGECVVVCPERAIPVNWDSSSRPLQVKTAEYALASVKNKKNKSVYFNFVLQVTPDCDCCNWNDLPIVPDVGILTSTDPVALDQCCLDLVNKSEIYPGSIIDGMQDKKDKFKAAKNHDSEILLSHSEKIGLGTRVYDLIEIN